VEILSED